LTYKGLNQVPEPAINVKVKELIDPNDHEIDALAGFRFHTNSREDVLRYLAEGQRCYVAKHQDQVVSSFWTMRNNFFDYRLKRWLQLAGEEEYALGFFTQPEFRGKGIFDYLFVEAQRDRFRNSPNLHMVIFVDVHNRASLKASYKIGFKKAGRIGYIGLFGLRFQYILGRDVLPNTKKRFLINI
jgi:hypothetical protein